ncbi:hypothetical protein ACFZC3_21105 [Streptomyces sp. NPDC007903]|uniref:hypothetical protein n=1 Tax=Streptomyces sp. NPDC007903 TaxID=3364786 RepID=UPI0036E377B2
MRVAIRVVRKVHATEQNYAEAREPSLRTEREAAEPAEREVAAQKQKAEQESRIKAQEARAAGMPAHLKGAGHRPLHGPEYYPQAALGLILDSLDGDLTPAADSVDKEVRALTG